MNDNSDDNPNDEENGEAELVNTVGVFRDDSQVLPLAHWLTIIICCGRPTWHHTRI
jgi:hypothetical protein